MALPFSPRASFDLIYDFNIPAQQAKRSYNDGTTNGKHVCIIGNRTAIDTGPGLAFYDCQSVTIIGGYFRPNANGWGRGGGGNYGTGSYAPGLLSFTGIKEQVYLEGVVTDNRNLYVDNPEIGENGGDAIYFAGKEEAADFYAQNCHFTRVRGTQTPAQAHADVFQTSSTTMGKAGIIEFYNCTADCNYQGIFTDPQAPDSGYPPTGVERLRIRRFNIKRFEQPAGGYRLSFIFSSKGNWDARGYPVTYENFWVQGWGTETLENTIWPNHEPGSNSFPDSHQARYGTDSTGRFAHYPGLTATAYPTKPVLGKIYQGAPPGGDFCPIDKVGLNYVQGTDFSTTTPTDPTTPTTATGGGTGGLLNDSWVKSGPGTVTNSPGLVSIISDGAATTSAAQEVTVRAGKLHRFTYTGESQTFTRKIGAAQEGAEYLASGAGVIGLNSHTFTPATDKVWVQFQRLSANTAIAKSLRLVDLDPPNRVARKLNGGSQYFALDVLANGFPALNANFVIGAWWEFQTLPSTGGIYLYDFGVLAPAGSGGGSGRVRLIFDATQNRLVASNQANAASTPYREHYLATPGFAVATPVFIGLAVKSDGDPYPIIGTRRGGGTISGSLPTLQSGIGEQLRIGTTARTTPAAGQYANATIWDAFWHVGSIPSDAVLTALAGGQRPHQISGFTPTYHWPMSSIVDTKDEESISGLATLRQVGAPLPVAPPVAPEPDPLPLGYFML